MIGVSCAVGECLHCGLSGFLRFVAMVAWYRCEGAHCEDMPVAVCVGSSYNNLAV